MKLDEITRYSKLYNVSPNWLITGEKDERKALLNNIHIWKIGSVGNLPDGEIEPVDPKGNIDFFPRMTIIPDKSAFIDVNGPQAKGFARGGWKIICEDTFNDIDHDYIHQLCVIRDVDGRMYLRILREIIGHDVIMLETPLGEMEKRSRSSKCSLVGIILPPAGVDAGLKIIKELSYTLRDAVSAAQNHQDGEPSFSRTYSLPFPYDWQAFRFLADD